MLKKRGRKEDWCAKPILNLDDRKRRIWNPVNNEEKRRKCLFKLYKNIIFPSFLLL